MTYENIREVNLMVWEQNPNKRNINNEIKVNVHSAINIKAGDRIRGGDNSYYEITEVIETRPSSLKNYNYVTAKTKWSVN